MAVCAPHHAQSPGTLARFKAADKKAGGDFPPPSRVTGLSPTEAFSLAALPVHPAVAPLFWTQLQLLVVSGGVHILVGIAILVGGWVLAGWAKRGLTVALARLPLDLTLKPLLASVARYIVLLLTLLLVIGNFGVQTTSLIAVLGAAGLAIGLALQGTLSNVASGVMLLVLRPFRVGQFVEVAGGKQGTVREIGLFTTLLITRDNVYVSIPNSEIFGGVTVNFTRERTRRVKFDVPVDRTSDLDLVEKTITETLAANPALLREPAPSAVVTAILEYTVVMTARGHARSADYWKALYSAQKDVKTALDRAGILMPVTRQAPVVRNEPISDVTRPAAAELGDKP
jgi:small conductance mechanosensitive channel